MKATLEFILPEEKVELDMATHVVDLQSAIFDFNQKLRNIINHSDNDEEVARAEWARDLLWKELEECSPYFEF